MDLQEREQHCRSKQQEVKDILEKEINNPLDVHRKDCGKSHASGVVCFGVFCIGVRSSFLLFGF
jgi:hypothetical protein